MGVDFDVFVADVDVEDELPFEVFEVDFAYRAGGGRLGGGDRLLEGDGGLREEFGAVVDLAGVGRFVAVTGVVLVVGVVGVCGYWATGEPFEEKMRRLTGTLWEQMGEGQRLDEAIEANLKGLGYGR